MMMMKVVRSSAGPTPRALPCIPPSARTGGAGSRFRERQPAGAVWAVPFVSFVSPQGSVQGSVQGSEGTGKEGCSCRCWLQLHARTRGWAVQDGQTRQGQGHPSWALPRAPDAAAGCCVAAH